MRVGEGLKSGMTYWDITTKDLSLTSVEVLEPVYRRLCCLPIISS